MRQLPRPRDLPGEADEAAYTAFSWRTDPITYNDLPQHDGATVRAARGFCVEDEVWFDPYPLSDHIRWWSEVIGEEYGREWESADPNHILYFKVPESGDFLIPYPKGPDADPEAVLRFAHLMRFLEVPEEVPVYWTLNGIATDRAHARDYYALIK